MNISKKKIDALYKAISDPIMGMRIAVKQSENVLGVKNASDIDDLLYRLELSMWEDVKKALDISEI